MRQYYVVNVCARCWVLSWPHGLSNFLQNKLLSLLFIWIWDSTEMTSNSCSYECRRFLLIMTVWISLGVWKWWINIFPKSSLKKAHVIIFDGQATYNMDQECGCIISHVEHVIVCCWLFQFNMAHMSVTSNIANQHVYVCITISFYIA